VSFATLALVGVIALLGPLLALPDKWNLPLLLGELTAGVAFGRTGLQVLPDHNSTFDFLGQIGFGLIMFVAGTRVPLRDPQLRAGLAVGSVRAIGIGVLAIPLGLGVSAIFDTGHAALYAVLIASSSAALILPIVDSLHLGGPHVVHLLPQVALADVACIVALPLVIDPAHAGRAALGGLAVIGCAAVAFLALRRVEKSGWRRRAHRLSERRKFALELRVSLLVLFALCALATATHVSILLAGFSLGLVTGGVGEPRRLARQLFGITEGFFGPLFFVWLGASLDLRELGQRPSYVGLGLLLGAGAIIAHLAPRVLGQPAPIGLLAAAQLGVPVAAVTVGTQQHLLSPAEASALLLGALVTIAVATVGGTLAVRAGLVRPADPPAVTEASGSVQPGDTPDR
jgi:Kef-type K+ transport system membrane component KefB